MDKDRATRGSRKMVGPQHSLGAGSGTLGLSALQTMAWTSPVTQRLRVLQQTADRSKLASGSFPSEVPLQRVEEVDGKHWITDPDNGKTYESSEEAAVAEEVFRAKTMSDHAKKLHGERGNLEKWNLDGDSRNQGLRHIIDYAYAPPPKAASNKQMDKYGELANRVMSPKDMKKAGIEIDVAAGLKDGSLELVRNTPKGDATKASIETKKAERKLLMSGVEASKKREVAQSGPYKQLTEDIKSLEDELKFEGLFTLAQDTSKMGRLSQVEAANGMAAGDIKGNEISTVTGTLDRLGAAATKVQTLPEPNTTYRKGPGEWEKNSEGTPKARAAWKKSTDEKQVPNTAVNAGFESEGLSVKEWGPTADQMRYSTMMGASKSNTTNKRK